MKSLQTYIKESCEKSCSESKTFTFNVKDMDNVDELKKSLESLDNVKIDGDTITVTACKECDMTAKAYDILKKYSDKERSSQHRSSDEQYAQKTVKFETNVNELNEYMNEEPVEKEEGDEKPEDEKDKNEKEEEKA